MHVKSGSKDADPLESERFEAMLESGSFARFLSRVKAEGERAAKDCHKADEPREIYRLQGQIHALRTVLELPENIRKELRKS